jgi:arsenite methyltransferase
MTMQGKTSEYFQQVAGQWDQIRSGYFSEEVRKAAVERAYLRLEMVVADIGAGSGFIASGLVDLVQTIHLVDASAAMLDEAKHNLSQYKNVEFHLADGLALPFRDGQLDVVFANMYLHHCVDPLVSIVEMVRVLKPGGRLVITDMDEHNNEWFKTEMADEWLGFDRDLIRNWFKKADLVNTVVDGTGQNCCASSVSRQEAIAETSVFVATATRRIIMRDAVQAAYAARAESNDSDREKPGIENISVKDQPEASQSVPPVKSSCCSGNSRVDDIQFLTGYSTEDINGVPAEAEELSLGCGNPTAMANLQPGEIVLDIGSGGGIDAFIAAKKVGSNGYVIGVDMTPAMLNRARASAMKANIFNVEFRYGHAESIPVEDNSVDVIISNCVINLCEDKGLVFKEAYRTLKPGGRLEISDMVTSRPLSVSERMKAFEWAECISGALPEKEYLDLITEAGFYDLRVARSTSSGEMDGVSVYSAIVSAYKPGPSKVQTNPIENSSFGCGCKSGCC